jgi:hypothetical protein
MRRIRLFIVLLLWSAALPAANPKTFEIETEGGSFTVTQDIPEYFFGKYAPLEASMEAGGLELIKSRNLASQHWRVSKDRTRKFTWGVIVKDGKIETEKVSPPNVAYRPYERMRLILQYEDGALEAMQMYRAVSEKYGTRIVIGRYVKASKK